ncbi:elongation of very long chain fatty acids protein 1-like [Pollicipes pollicipes]|uniref:elongation of very long chain fatty acids protein 1-like n=1 Tax=Pollicipes pollicipes TaxID=41117 RepID=UPI00188540BF|nr:elongation of very long chain fatty acids protein 1-like [Pollicipes pollicipes]
MEVIRSITNGLVHRRDPRVRDYVMQSSPEITLGATAGYMLLVAYGPRLMKNRPTPPLRLVMFLYNIGQVCLSAHMMHEFWVSRPSTRVCAPLETSDDRRARRLVDACWLFHISKIIDFLDTVFLVLKKDHKRMTYLHVYHHASMNFGFWLGTLFCPGGSTWIPGVLNSFVHCVMYSYYLLASLGPRVRPYLWWKRYLTQLQLAQFAIIVLCTVMVQVEGGRCGMPFWTCSMTFVYLIVLTGLFVNFYVRCYLPMAGRGLSPSPAAAPPAISSEASIPAPAPPPIRKAASCERPGVMADVVRAILSHGVGCFTKED